MVGVITLISPDFQWLSNDFTPNFNAYRWQRVFCLSLIEKEPAKFPLERGSEDSKLVLLLSLYFDFYRSLEFGEPRNSFIA